MRVAVITPYYLEDERILQRCYSSVKSQTYPDKTHIFVADGHASHYISQLNDVDHIILSHSHSDAGATPRALAAISAFSRGYDAVSFLDADNTMLPVHLETMVSMMTSTGSGIIAATRNICTTQGEIMYVDTIESTGQDFCDTNCMFLGRPTLHALTYWITDPAARLWSDRQFWSVISQSNLQKTVCEKPTVNYITRWAWHYQHAGRQPPSDSVWLDVDQSGILSHTTHR